MSRSSDTEAVRSKGQAGADPGTIPLAKIDVSDSELFETDTHWGYFERLRKEDPVHHCAASDFGPYWSVTRYDDVVHVEKKPEVYSSARSIVVGDPDPSFPLGAGFITMDGARHDAHRAGGAAGRVAAQLAVLEPLIRARAREILDGLPIGETFDWVDRVSIELTTGMLATLFDFPYAERRKLTLWSDMATASPLQVGAGDVTEEDRQAELMQCLAEFTALWKQREHRAPSERLDFITALANADATRGMDPMEYLGTLILLIVGGNDTTRNSITGGVLALNENPDEYRKLRETPSLVPNMVSEIIRWQTPLAHMRRTATRDAELAGKPIAKGDKVVLWYVSANRDEAVFDRPNDFWIDRPNARQHLAFGIGVHFCMGSRLAEMQLRVMWEETLARFREVEVVGPPRRVRSNFVKGYTYLPVQVHPW
jgi:cytochrome P450